VPEPESLQQRGCSKTPEEPQPTLEVPDFLHVPGAYWAPLPRRQVGKEELNPLRL